MKLRIYYSLSLIRIELHHIMVKATNFADILLLLLFPITPPKKELTTVYQTNTNTPPVVQTCHPLGESKILFTDQLNGFINNLCIIRDLIYKSFLILEKKIKTNGKYAILEKLLNIYFFDRHKNASLKLLTLK